MEGHNDGRTLREQQPKPGIHAVPRRPDSQADAHITAGSQASDWTPTLLTELLPSLDQAVTRLILTDPELVYDRREQTRTARYLNDLGVTAFGGIYAARAVHYTLWYSLNGIERLVGSDDRRHSHERYRDEVITPTLTQFCTGSGVFHDDGIDVLKTGPLRLFEVADITPRITITLDAAAWRGTDHRETRERSLAVLSAFSKVCHIDLVISPGLYAYLDRRHPDWSDEHLSSRDYLTRRHGSSPNTALSSDVDSNPMDAWNALNDIQSKSGRIRLLAQLSSDGKREERDLARDVDVDLDASSVTAYASDLEERGLVSVDRRGRYNAVSLTALGRAAQNLITTEYRVVHPHQSELAELHLTPTPQPDASTVCPPPASTREDESAPTVEEWMTNTGDPSECAYVQWLGDANVDARHLRPLNLHRRFTAPVRVDGINLVDEPVEELDDARVSYLSAFDDEALAIVEWGGSLPTLVRLATTLFSKRAFSKLLTPSRIGDDFANVFDGDLDSVLGDLQQRTQIGWFGKDEFQEYDQFRSRFLGVRRNLLERLAKLVDSDDTEARQKLYEDAHGFLTCATHLYRALGVDVTFTIRFPDTSTLLRKDDVRQDFLEFIEHTVPKHGAYGTHSYYRHAFETREDKVRFAMPPDVEADINATATASWVFAGPTITDLEDDITAALGSRREDDQFDDRSHDPIPWTVPVADCNTYAGIRNVVEQFAERKGFDAVQGSQDLRHVIRILLAVTGQGVLRGSPYDVAEAMQYLAQPLDPGQPIRVSDFEFALGQLPADRLFPDLPPSVGSIAKVLLVAEKPLGRSEIIDRAGISGSTYGRRISELDSFDFIEQHEDRRWDIHLSPWFVREGNRSHPDFDNVSVSGMQGVLWEVIDLDKLDDDVCEALAELDSTVLFERLPWLRGWWAVLETLTAHIDACRDQGLLGETPRRVRLGEPPPVSYQSPLSAHNADRRPETSDGTDQPPRL
jgi:DNA-binding MarR family transcriptional regulator